MKKIIYFSLKTFIILILIISNFFIIKTLISFIRVKNSPILNNDFITIAPKKIPTATPTLPQIKSVLHEVPFTPQAPFANWADPIQQDACEEAVALMAVRWAKNENLSREEALREIITASKFQTEKYGSYQDTSLEDTVERIIKGYYHYDEAVVKIANSAEDLIFELLQNHLVLVPLNGRALNNPNFTQPGPERHMVVVKGYDRETDEFITNDPGINNGEGYRYPVDVLYDAIREYSTGYHVPINEIKKSMIVIYPL